MAGLGTTMTLQRPWLSYAWQRCLPRYPQVYRAGDANMGDMGVMDEIAQALRDSMSPSDRLASWSFRWTVQDGRLACSQCQASQSANRPGEPFAHRPDCCARRDQQPWQDLAALLARL